MPSKFMLTPADLVQVRRHRWRVARKVFREYGATKEKITQHVRLAMSHSGLTDAGAVRSAQSWYRRWIAKAVDEVVYADLAPRWREHVAIPVGCEDLIAARSAGRPVVLLGAHIGSHTIGLSYLDAIGLPLLIVIHPSMAVAVGNYGLKHASFISNGWRSAGQLARLKHENGIVALYTDVERTGLPKSPTSLELPPSVVRLIQVMNPSVYSWQVSAGRSERHMWQLEFQRAGSALRGAQEQRLQTVERIRSRPEEWMLWRRIPVGGIQTGEFPWPRTSD